MQFKKITDLSFEQAVEELENIAKQLESNNVGLDDAVALFARANELKQFCDAKLKSAKTKVEKIITDGENITGSEEISLN